LQGAAHGFFDGVAEAGADAATRVLEFHHDAPLLETIEQTGKIVWRTEWVWDAHQGLASVG
jgi:hypothetical protein